jgi:hypothetical protein
MLTSLSLALLLPITLIAVASPTDTYRVVSVPPTLSDMDLQNRLNSYTTQGCWVHMKLGPPPRLRPGDESAQRLLLLCHH